MEGERGRGWRKRGLRRGEQVLAAKRRLKCAERGGESMEREERGSRGDGREGKGDGGEEGRGREKRMERE